MGFKFRGSIECYRVMEERRLLSLILVGKEIINYE